MAVVEAVISSAVEKIGDVMVQEARSLHGVSDRVNELQAELTRMRCFLKDAESRKGNSESIRNWVAEIRNVAYDAEDILEIYQLKAAINRWKNPITLHKVGSEIDAIMARLTNLTASLPGLTVLKDEERPGSSSVKKLLRQSYSHKIDRNVVGLDQDIALLSKQLKATEYQVVSICGMGGLGKTTLAKKVYHQCKHKRDFDFFVWVFVSQQWGRRNIWESVLYELISPTKESSIGFKTLWEKIMKWEDKKESSSNVDDNYKVREKDIDFGTLWEKIKSLEDKNVAELLHDELRWKKCLVVLDDIWDNVWHVLEPAFPTKEETRSKFMITTRNRNLAQGYIHEGTNHLVSAMMIAGNYLQRLQVGYGNEPSLEELGKEMVRHCGGLPLGIVVLGGLLSTKTTYDEWDTINRTIKSYFKGLGFGIAQILALSYDDLPYDLKPCFLYLGMFPEDFVISRDRLINLWVAEGFINQPRVEREGEEALEDVAYRYLTELAQRYMIIVEKRDPFGRIKTFQMHDLMRDFCLSKSEEENFLQVVPLYGTRASLNLSSSSSSGRVRRLSLHLNNFPGNVGDASECEEYPPIRSLLGFSLAQHSGISPTFIETLIGSFKLLRILELEKVEGFKISQTIGMLIHLRLLNLSIASVVNLPWSIGNLSRLLTLRLECKHSPRTTPNFFPKLKRLRHLYLPRYPGSNKKWLVLAHLTDLQTLVNFSTSNADVDDLIRLANLRKLKILIYDDVSLRKFKAIFKSSTISFNYLRSFSIKSHGRLRNQDVDNIKSRCPRLLRLKFNNTVVYQKMADVSRLEEDDFEELENEGEGEGGGRSCGCCSDWKKKFC